MSIFHQSYSYHLYHIHVSNAIFKQIGGEHLRLLGRTVTDWGESALMTMILVLGLGT